MKKESIEKLNATMGVLNHLTKAIGTEAFDTTNYWVMHGILTSAEKLVSICEEMILTCPHEFEVAPKDTQKEKSVDHGYNKELNPEDGYRSKMIEQSKKNKEAFITVRNLIRDNKEIIASSIYKTLESNDYNYLTQAENIKFKEDIKYNLAYILELYNLNDEYNEMINHIMDTSIPIRPNVFNHCMKMYKLGYKMKPIRGNRYEITGGDI